MKFWKLALIGVAGVVGLGVVGLAGAAWWVQARDVGGLVTWVANRAGVPVVLGGPVRVDLWPQLVVRTEAVQIPSAQESAEPVLRLARSELAADWGPGLMFWQGLQVRRISLTEPVAFVRVGANGQGNWPGAKTPEASEAGVERVDAAAEAGDAGFGQVLALLSGAVVDVTGLQVDYANAQNGQKLLVTKGDIRASTDGSVARTTLNGLVNGDRVQGNLQVDVANLADVPLQFNLRGLGVQVRAEGRVTNQQQFAGQVAASTENLRASYQNVLGTAPEAVPAAVVRINGDVAAGPERVALRSFRAQVGDLLDARGDAEVTLGDKPGAKGDVAVSGQNLRQLAALALGAEQAAGLPGVPFSAEAKLAGEDAIEVPSFTFRLSDVATVSGRAKAKLASGFAPKLEANVRVNAGNMARLMQVLGVAGTYPREALHGQFEVAGQEAWQIQKLKMTLGEGDQAIGTIAGQVELGAAPGRAVTGALQASGPSVVRLAEGFGWKVTGLPNSGFEAGGSLAGGGENGWDIKDLKVDLPGLVEVTGEGGYVPGQVPLMRGNIQISKLNATAFGWCSAVQSGANGSKPVANQAQNGRATDAAGSGAAPWSDDPLPVEQLRKIGADVTLTVRGIVCGNIPIETTNVTVRNTPSRLSLEGLDLGFAQGGRLQGKVMLDHASTPQLDVNLNGQNLALETFVPPLAQRGVRLPLNAEVQLVGEGATSRALAQALAGRLVVTADKGQVPYGNLLGNVMALERALRGAAEPAGNGSGTVDKFEARYVVRGGVANTEVFNLSTNNGAMVVNGAGTVDVGNWRVDYTLTPQVAVGGGLAVPVRVTGALSAPTIGADPAFVQRLTSRLAAEGIESLLGVERGEAKGIGAAVGEVLQGRPGEGVQNLIGGFLGGKRAQTQPSPTMPTAPDGGGEAAPEVPANPLNNLLQQVLPPR